MIVRGSAVALVVACACRTSPVPLSGAEERGKRVVSAEDVGAWIREEVAFTLGQDVAAGTSVAGGGDVDGDGYDDVLVGVAGVDPYGYAVSDEGAAYVFHGGPEGVGGGGTQLLPSDRQVPGSFGAAVANAGDLDGDGYDDLAVVAPSALEVDDDPDGALYVYLGGPGGIDPATELKRLPAESTEFGAVVAGAGDVDGDGYDDLLIGGKRSSTEDGVFLYRGAPGGLAEQPVLVPVPAADNPWIALAVAGAGDIDGDGYDDVVVGVPEVRLGGREGAVYWLLGGEDGLQTPPHLLDPSGDTARDGFGRSVTSAGDVNGDGYADVLVSALNRAGVPEGAAYLYLGSAAGLGDVAEALVAEYAQPFGQAVAGPVDVDGDGFDDLVVSSLHEAGARLGVAVYRGGPEGISALAPAAFQVAGTDPRLVWVAGAGDPNGDGLDEVVVGVTTYNRGEGPGEAFVYAFCDDPSWYVDADGDGYGDADGGRLCTETDLAAAQGGDCDDEDSDVFPGAPEVPLDGIDDDCDGADADAEADSASPELLDDEEGRGGFLFELGDCGCAGGSPSQGGMVLVLLWLVRRRPG